MASIEVESLYVSFVKDQLCKEGVRFGRASHPFLFYDNIQMLKIEMCDAMSYLLA